VAKNMGHFWEYKLGPEFPFNIVEYETCGTKDKLHWHSYLEIGLCVEGSGKFIFGNKEYDVVKGDIFVINNFENHVAVSDLPETTKYIFLFFLPELIAAPGSSEFSFEYLSPFWYDPGNFCNKVDHSTETARILNQTILEIRDLWNDKEIGYQHIVDANIKKVLAYLIKHYKTNCDCLRTQKIDDRFKLQPAVDYINEHYKENIRLDEVASLLHISESRFRHLFKEIMHIGFKEYITYLRINEAKRLLLVTDMSISDIINSVQFSSNYHFYKLFYKYESISPAEYRKSYNPCAVNSSTSNSVYQVVEIM
jgi:AraC-like DNA-binding protein